MREPKRIDRAPSLDDHIPDGMLLCAADGELGSPEAAMVRSHLEACWSCRVRMEKIEQAIADLVDYRAALVRPHLPPGSAPAILAARLRECASLDRPAPAWRRLMARAKAVSGARLVPAIVRWAPLAIVAAIFLARTTQPPTVSANAILERARISEQLGRHSVKHPVVYQKLRIRSKAGTVTRTIYHDTLLGREVDSADAGQAVVSNLRQRLQEAEFDWQDPLSVPAFISWRARLPEKSDEITHPADGLLTLHTRAANGPVSEVNLTLRDSDYHAVAETVCFQDSETIETDEIAFSVLAAEMVNPSIFALAGSSFQPRLLSVVHPVPRPSLQELADAEVKARVALHNASADLGEQIDVKANNGKDVIVSGLVDTPERRQQLLQVLQGIRYVRTRLNTLGDALSQEAPAKLEDEAPVMAVEVVHPLDGQLAEKFPDPEERKRFVNEVLENALAAVSRGWALRRLSDRYTPDVTSQLNLESRRRLELLVRDDVGLLQQELDHLGALLARVNPNRVVEASQDSESSVMDTIEFKDWHGDVDSMLSDLDQVHENLSALLSGSNDANVDAPGLMRDVELAIARTQRRLPGLCQEIKDNVVRVADFNPDTQEKGDIR